MFDIIHMADISTTSNSIKCRLLNYTQGEQLIENHNNGNQVIIFSTYYNIRNDDHWCKLKIPFISFAT